MNTNNDKGRTQPVSFPVADLELYEYVHNLALERFGHNFSDAIRDCIKAHKKASEYYGDWRQMETPPGWAKEIIDKEK